MGMGGSVEGVSPWKKTLFVDGYVSLKCIEVCLGMAFIKNGVGGIFYGKRREGRKRRVLSRLQISKHNKHTTKTAKKNPVSN